MHVNTHIGKKSYFELVYVNEKHREWVQDGVSRGVGVKNLVSEDLYRQRCVKKKYCFNFFTV